jgi:hypothetical protein
MKTFRRNAARIATLLLLAEYFQITFSSQVFANILSTRNLFVRLNYAIAGDSLKNDTHAGSCSPIESDGGPSSPELQKFEQAGNANLVNLFNGNFRYGIDLLDVGGYPISMSYSSEAVKMESEAACVGLGWSLDVGSISRDVRGLPDDYKGDLVKKEINMRPQEEGGAAVGVDVEITGFSTGDLQASVSGGTELSVSRSTYDGWEIDLGMDIASSLGGESGDFNLEGSLGSSFSLNNKTGAGYGFGANFSGKYSQNKQSAQLGLALGLDVNAREGIKSLSFTPSAKYTLGKERNFGGHNVMVKGSYGINSKFPISFNSPSMSPAWEVSKNTDAISWRLKLGGELPLTHISGTLKGHYSKTYLQTNYDSVPAYGYIYSEHAGSRRELLDFNREKDRAFRAELPNLPVAQFTYDVYSVNGHGIEGSFRPFRGDVGTLHDPFLHQNNTAGTVGAELGVGQMVKAGADLQIIYTHSESKKWEEGNRWNSVFSFKGENESEYEPVYFKNLGEATTMANPEQFNAIGNERPIRAEVNSDGTTSGNFVFGAGRAHAEFNPDHVLRDKREIRNTHFSFLNAQEASHHGLNKSIKTYPAGVSPVWADRNDVPNDLQPNYIQRKTDHRKAHHLSEITVTRTDGARYVYGIPAYTLFESDYTFNVSGFSAEPDSDKQISYSGNYHARTIRNNFGLDRFFECETRPAYPHAWLLSGVLADDYVDLTGDGPTPDDFGNYTKINYRLAHSNYKWRTPNGKNLAHYQENKKRDDEDNYASFSYGAKEVWYVHSVESRNLVAEFYYSNRKDACSVLDEDGGNDPNKTLQKLDSIKLFSKSERLLDLDRCTPLKKVVFTYSYDLCKGVPGAVEEGLGKLTLTGIYFTYGNSERGSRSPYVFSYSEVNPDYKPKSVDKWGNYIEKMPGEDVGSYASLTKEKADRYASAWLLNAIQTPEGAHIKVTYESDDFAYVQNKRAMELFTLYALTGESDKNNVPSSEIPSESVVYNEGGVYNYAKFKLKFPTSDPAVLERYFEGMQELYFTSQMELGGEGQNKYEKVDGFIPCNFALINNNIGFCTEGASGPYQYAWVKLPRLTAGDSNTEIPDGVHPFAKTAWQKINKSMPEMIYNDPSPMTDDPAAFVESMAAALSSIEGFYRNPYEVLANGKHAARIKLGKSKIRLFSPNLVKFGGGARVKKITVSDNWDIMSGTAGTEATYGTEYLYTTKANLGGQEVEISSGVNSYEPATNSEENPFSVPRRYSIEAPLSIDQSLYFTGPVGESFFPGAMVGYSKVKVRNLQYENVTNNATGFSVHEFYTAKDFPSLTFQTDLQVNPREVPVPPFYSEKQFTVSQGFSIELNNMHGQQKAVHVFQETDSLNPISGQQFFYHTGTDNRLSNYVLLVNPENGEVNYGNLGLEYDFYVDARESVSETYAPAAAINTDGFMAAMLPLFFPMVYPMMNYSMKRYRAITYTKVLYRNGILDRVLSYNNGANVSLTKTVFDAQTGEALVTEAENEFGKKEYSIQLPAYWVYSGMDGAFKNQGRRLSVNLPALGDFRTVFHVGDELLIHNYAPMVPELLPGFGGRRVAAPAQKAWVLGVSAAGISLIDQNGNPITSPGSYTVEIIRSGRRNHQSQLAGSLYSLANPVVTSGLSKRLEFPTEGIIGATAVEFSDVWQTYAAFQTTLPQYQCVCRETANKSGLKTASALADFLKSLMSSGDFTKTGVPLSGGVYATFGSFVNYMTRKMPQTYNGFEGASEFRGELINSDSTTCGFSVEMADGTSLFPDNVTDLKIDLSLTDDSDRAACDNAYSALGTLTYREAIIGNQAAITYQTKTARVRVHFDCFPLIICSERYVGEGELTCSAAGSGTVNPFVADILGCWRKKSDYTFRSERTISTTAEGGTINGFKSFFTNFPIRVKEIGHPDRANWQLAASATVYDPFGRNIESRNSLGIHSSEVFGYGFSLPILAASNARYTSVAFDGFEDYQYKNIADNPWNDCTLQPHFRFDTTSAKIVSDVSHSGMSCLRTSSSVTLNRKYKAVEEPSASAISGGRFNANQGHLIQPFVPDTTTFFLSAWLSKGAPGAVSSSTGAISPALPESGGGTMGSINTGTILNIGNSLGLSQPLINSALLGGAGSLLDAADIVVKARTVSGTDITLVSAKAEGKSVDGWKQVNTVFKVPTNVQSLSIQLNANGSQTWFDDIRVQPFNSSMKTFVYDPFSLRMMAMLDENNFATFYEYDNEGNLVRTKKETDEKIITLQEIRSSKPKIRE